ncbi:cupin domain-containing protein [Paenibacillus albus]|uniref:Cupin domain-containing protein n=1 Tax=Paenibacillus albus TaxID=2495582 RepID=A0A3Q8X3X9_9BACL|nr:cupin domain-containing protein [Paenibacillus albus]AZN38679.1 cupin domain-containing protein [Paenibacillus albus]
MKVSKHSAEHYVWGDVCDGWHLVKDERLSIIHERMPAGTSEVRHYHEQSRQFFFVLTGSLAIELGGEVVELEPQEGVEVPPLTPHQVRNVSGEAAEFLVISSPTTRGDRHKA